MSLKAIQIINIGRQFQAGKSVDDLAAAYGVGSEVIRFHLKQKGLLTDNIAAEAAPVEQPAGPEFTHDDEHPSDADLGVGEEVRAPAMDLNALMANPEFAKLVDQAVAARLAQVAPAAASDSRSEEMKGFVASLAHLIEVQAMQQPGYIKPISAEELDRRAGGLVKMKALLKDFEAKGCAPLYLVGEGGFFECTNAQEFQPGDQIKTYLPPSENFIPRNREAEEVYGAMLVWIGGHTPGIGEQVEAAMQAAHGQVPLVTGALNPGQPKSKVELVHAPRVPVGPRRQAGTIVPERHDVSLAERAAGPQGPVFVGDRAVA
jgi:hypothetical protein